MRAAIVCLLLGAGSLAQAKALKTTAPPVRAKAIAAVPRDERLFVPLESALELVKGEPRGGLAALLLHGEELFVDLLPLGLLVGGESERRGGGDRSLRERRHRTG